MDINWQYLNQKESRIFWSFSSDVHLHSTPVFDNFKLAFKIDLKKKTERFTLTKEQIIYLTKSLQEKIKSLFKSIESIEFENQNGIKV